MSIDRPYSVNAWVARLVVALVAVGRRERAAQRLQRGGDVEPSPAAVPVAPQLAAGTPGRGVDVGGRALEQRRHLVGGERRPHRDQQRRRRRHLRRRVRRAVRRAELGRPAERVALVDAGRARRGQRPRQRRDDPDARRGDVVEDRVAVRERRHRAVGGERAHPDHVRERRRVAGVLPRRLRRLVAVPDRGDDDRALRVRVRDRVLLDLGVGVLVAVEAGRAGRRGERLITRAPLSAAQRIAFASSAGEIVPSDSTTFAISSCAGKAIPAIPSPLSVDAAMIPATKVPWPCRSVTSPPTKLCASAMRPANSGWPASIPESITATRTGPSAGGSSGQKSNAWIGAEVPLLGDERVVGHEVAAPRRPRPAAPGRPRAARARAASCRGDDDLQHGTLDRAGGEPVQRRRRRRRRRPRTCRPAGAQRRAGLPVPPVAARCSSVGALRPGGPAAERHRRPGRDVAARARQREHADASSRSSAGRARAGPPRRTW